MSNIMITDISETSHAIACNRPELAALMPHITGVHYEFVISPVNPAIANAIRRVLSSELVVKGLFCEIGDIMGTDPFIIQENMCNRVKMIPLMQDCPDGAVFELDATCTDLVARDVKTSEIRVKNAGKYNDKNPPFNKTITLCTIQPTHSIKILATVRSAAGDIKGEGMRCVAVNAASCAVDQQPLNTYEGTGIPSRLAAPTVFKVSFTTNGTMKPADIVIAACDNLLSRVRKIKASLSITSKGDEHIIVIPGETDTIGCLFMRTVHELYPNVLHVHYDMDETLQTCSVFLRINEDPGMVISAVVSLMLKTFTVIRGHFQ